MLGEFCHLCPHICLSLGFSLTFSIQVPLMPEESSHRPTLAFQLVPRLRFCPGCFLKHKSDKIAPLLKAVPRPPITWGLFPRALYKSLQRVASFYLSAAISCLLTCWLMTPQPHWPPSYPLNTSDLRAFALAVLFAWDTTLRVIHVLLLLLVIQI